MAFDLKFASLSVRKAAAIRGITRGMFRPDRSAAGYETDQVIVTSRDDKSVMITANAQEYAAQFTWAEIKEHFNTQLSAGHTGQPATSERIERPDPQAGQKEY